MSDPSIHRRMASNRKKISKLFPNEFLPEELSGIKMCQSVPWCWTNEAHSCKVEDEWPSVQPIDEDSQLWAELYNLESWASKLLAEKSEEELADVADELDDWLKSYVCTEGVLSPDPWQTQAIPG